MSFWQAIAFYAICLVGFLAVAALLALLAYFVLTGFFPPQM